MLKKSYTFRSFGEARQLAEDIGSCCESCQNEISAALKELFLNAIEHGNLGISYEEKSELLRDGLWESEVERRLALTENQSKQVEVLFEEKGSRVYLVITDQGPGFNFEEYVCQDVSTVHELHGRGIFLALNSLDKVTFLPPGNRVEVEFSRD